jgi:hypothetical protein
MSLLMCMTFACTAYVNMGGVDMAGIRMMSAGIISPMPDGKLRP